MKTLLISTGLIVFLFLSASSKVAAQERNVSKPKPSTKTTVVSRPIKVLIRAREAMPFPKGKLEALFSPMGMFIMKVRSVEDSKPSLKLLTQFSSGGRITVENDRIVDAQKETWKWNSTYFDFVVNWEREWSRIERPSDIFRINDLLCKPERLRVSSSETWIVEKTSDPTVKNTWQISSYTLTGPLQYPDSIACMMKTAPPVANAFVEKQVRSVIVPARGPVLKKVRAFINSNTPND